MTEQDRYRIEKFRQSMRVNAEAWSGDAHDAIMEDIEIFETFFPKPKPKDPIEECREEMMNHGWHPQCPPAEVALALQNIFKRHFPKKETT
jgi:hypothetical protein